VALPERLLVMRKLADPGLGPAGEHLADPVVAPQPQRQRRRDEDELDDEDTAVGGAGRGDGVADPEEPSQHAGEGRQPDARGGAA
jgi:hypothetical protein